MPLFTTTNPPIRGHWIRWIPTAPITRRIKMENNNKLSSPRRQILWDHTQRIGAKNDEQLKSIKKGDCNNKWMSFKAKIGRASFSHSFWVFLASWRLGGKTIPLFLVFLLSAATAQ